VVLRKNADPDCTSRFLGWQASRHFADLAFEAAVNDNPDSAVHLVSQIKSEWRRDKCRLTGRRVLERVTL
jgi:hypothetical protein